jgi:hypothetical protein
MASRVLQLKKRQSTRIVTPTAKQTSPAVKAIIRIVKSGPAKYTFMSQVSNR